LTRCSTPLEVLDTLAKRFPGAVPTLALTTSWFASRDGAVESDLLPHDKTKCHRCVEDTEALSTLAAHHPVETERDATILAMKSGFEAGFTTHFIKQQGHHEAAFHSRRIFRAVSGFIGLIPESGQKGDEIWMLFGCPAPVILRREPDGISYRLVGAAFVNILEGSEIQWESGATEDVRIV